MTAKPRILAIFGSRVLFGAERSNIEALASLRDAGCEVLCLVRHERWNREVPDAIADRGLALKRAQFIDNWLRGWRMWILLRNPFAWVVGNWQFLHAARLFRPTHVHTFNPFFVFSFLPALLVCRLPLVYRAGDVPTMHSWPWRLLWRFVKWRTGIFVAVSRFIRDELVATGISPERVRIVYGKVPVRVGPPAACPAKQQEGAWRNLIFVGQVAEHKGPHLLVDAFRGLAQRYPDARLLIIGKVAGHPGDWSWELLHRVEADDVLRSRVLFPGFIEDIPGMLLGGELLVAPSICAEAFGLVVVEAKAAGIPAVIFPSGGMTELVEHGVDGFVCRDKSAEALREALEAYLADPALARRQGAAARRSLAKFEPADSPGEWLKVYTSVA